jgi:TPR repeat protein
MKTGAGLDREELIKWWDAQDALHTHFGKVDPEVGLRMARECRHPDAQWLVSLFPADVAVTQEMMSDVLEEQGDDPRALYLVWRTAVIKQLPLLRRAAELGYAPAQGMLSTCGSGDAERYRWAQAAAAAGDRRGLFELGFFVLHGLGCEKDVVEAMELYRRSAELEFKQAQEEFGKLFYGKRDWERYYWWGRASSRTSCRTAFYRAIEKLLPSFERGVQGRVLHTVATVVLEPLDGVHFGEYIEGAEAVVNMRRVIDLHAAMLGRAKNAILCLGIIARRNGIVKDVRVLISKMVWQEPWHWSKASTN